MADTHHLVEPPRVLVEGASPPDPGRAPSALVSRWVLGLVTASVALIGYLVTEIPDPHIDWSQGRVPQPVLNAESLISTPTGFSILGGLGTSGGTVWSTTDGEAWKSRTLPRLSSRIVYHSRGLFVVDRRDVIRVGPDGDDPTARIDLADAVRIGNGSKRSGLVPGLGGLLVQLVSGDVHWAPQGRSFELVINAQTWRAESDVTPSPEEVAAFAPGRVRSVCRPRARRAPDVPPIVSTPTRIVALIPEHDPSVVWPACEPVPWTTIDGSSWSKMSEVSPFPERAYVFDLAWRAGRYVAVGGIGYDSARAWTSTDGVAWEALPQLTQEKGIQLTDVEAGGLGWILIGTPRDGSQRLGWYSADGVCWERLPEGVGGQGVAVGDERILLVDGVSESAVWVGSPTGSTGPFRRCAGVTPTSP